MIVRTSVFFLFFYWIIFIKLLKYLSSFWAVAGCRTLFFEVLSPWVYNFDIYLPILSLWFYWNAILNTPPPSKGTKIPSNPLIDFKSCVLPRNKRIATILAIFIKISTFFFIVFNSLTYTYNLHIVFQILSSFSKL